MLSGVTRERLGTELADAVCVCVEGRGTIRKLNFEGVIFFVGHRAVHKLESAKFLSFVHVRLSPPQN